VNRPETLIRQLSLRPHPEGGWYSEVFRSIHQVTPDDGRGTRAALTSIYFMLARGQRSRLHRVKSDEAWHFYEGAPIRLLTCDQRFNNLERTTLGPFDGVSRPTHIVPAGHWQAAESDGDYSLVGCTVAPGFDFSDFSMMRDDESRAAQFRARHTDEAIFV
jgi:predicted cupin superfamily sugar epimerase